VYVCKVDGIRRVNVAAWRPVWQSSTECDRLGFCTHGPERGNDNKLRPPQKHRKLPACARTGNDEHPWWSVDLGCPIYVDSVDLTSVQDRRMSGNYFGNLLFANYYTAVYSVVTATNFTWYSSICRNTPPNGHRITFPVWSVCVPNSDPPPVKISQIQPCRHPREEIARVGRFGEDPREDVGVGVVVDVGVVKCGLYSMSAEDDPRILYRLEAMEVDVGNAGKT